MYLIENLINSKLHRNGLFQHNLEFHFISVNGFMLDALHYHLYFWHGKFVKQEMLWQHEIFPWQ